MEEILHQIIDYPFIFEESLENGSLLEQHKDCSTCKSKDCIKKIDLEIENYECPSGYSCFYTKYKNKPIVINGLICWPLNTTITGKKRKLLKDYVISLEEICKTIKSIECVEDYISHEANNRSKDSVAFLHDIRTSVGIVLSCCEDLIDKQQGVTFEAKLHSVDRETFNLFNSITLLLEQLNLTDIIANPSSITYGKKYRSQLHGFLLKLVKLFRPRAATRNIGITLNGNTDFSLIAYNSFQFVPLILLDNAIKYSKPYTEIVVDINDGVKDISISVSSHGKIVPEDFREKIFEKYIRGPNVEKDHEKGIGLGLFIAKQIVIAHHMTIKYIATSTDGVFGINSFIITIQK